MSDPDDHPSEDTDPSIVMATVDIGIDGPALVEGASTIGSHGDSTNVTHETGDRRRRPVATWKVIAAIVGAAATVSLIFGALAGNDRSVDRALPEPTETAGATPTTAAAPEPTSGPEVEMVPIVGQGLSRAGERCDLPSPDRSATISFVVPDGLTARCGSVVVFWTDPVSARTSDPLPLELVIDDGDLQSWFVHWTEHRLPDRLNWSPLAGRRGWTAHFDRMTATGPDADEVLGALDLHVIEVPGGTVVVDWFHDARSTPEGTDLGEPFNQLVESLAVTVTAESNANHYLPEPGGWCSGDHHVARIPVGWFASPSCGALNTSSEGPIVLQCTACHPPLWIDSLTIAFDADYGFTRVDVDEIITRHDGVPIRVIEGLRPDGNNMERPLRAMIIDGGPRRIAVMSSQYPQHVLPGHTWEETLAAQQFLVDQLRFHSSPECGAGQRWVASGSDTVLIDVGWGTRWSVPSGAALIGTGCTRRETGDLEVRLEADPRIIGWIAADQVRSPTPTLCPTGEGAFDPRQWNPVAEGDFDGDGRADQVFVAKPFDGAPTFTDSPTLAVLFANGGLAEGVIGTIEGDGEPVTTAEVTARRLIGMGRDLLELRYVASEGFLSVDLRDPTTCDMGPVARGQVDLDDPATRGVCVDERAPSWTVMRSWTVIPAPGRLVEGSDVRWYARDGEVIIEPVTASVVVPCGPTLEPNRGNDVPGPSALAGTHPLTLQWAASSDGSTGEITFAPIGGHRYQVEGSHVAAPGASLEMYGVLRRVTRDELDFDGVVITQVAQLYGGEPCVRNAGQQFVRRPGTNVFRMQDRINCDGARTDWIDITLPD